jgi:hypothetical protein
MRQHILLLVLTGLVLTSCKKDNSGNLLAGKWRMVAVKDDATNTISTKPFNVNGDVDITFTFSTSVAGIMSGVTPTNRLQGDYVVENNKAILITSLSYSQVEETSWGLEFLNNIKFSKDYFFDIYGKLNINKNPDKTLTFVRN